MKKVVINVCFGGFGLSDEAYEKLIELGIPIKAYTKQPRNPKTRLYDIKVPGNEGKIIFDRSLGTIGKLTEADKKMDSMIEDIKFMGRYWDTWIDENRNHPLLIKVVEELGKKANGKCANLKIVKIPDDVDYKIEEYDGNEHIAEKHMTWQ